MRFIKHITTAHMDPWIDELMDNFGAEGYGVWWVILEKIAMEMSNTKQEPSAKFSLKNWANSARISPKKFQNLIKFCEKNSKIFVNVDENMITLTVPNLLKFKDEWTKRAIREAGATPEQLRSNSGETPVSESESESESILRDRLDKRAQSQSTSEINPELPKEIVNQYVLCFEKMPGKRDQATLLRLHKDYSIRHIGIAFNRTKEFGGRSLKYVEKILDALNSEPDGKRGTEKGMKSLTGEALMKMGVPS